MNVVKAACRIEDEIARRGTRLRGRGPERSGACLLCGGTDRFSINIRKQIWNCRGCAVGGDVVDLVQHFDGCDFKKALRTLGIEDWPPIAARPAPPPAPGRSPQDNSERALALWSRALPIAGTVAETYLRSRGLHYADPGGEALRFHPDCPFGGERYPCMLALFRRIVGNEPVAVHRTALTPDGRKIDRMTLGPISGGAIKLTADEDVLEGLHIAEGVETALAGLVLDFRPMWALGSAGGIAKFPLLGGVESLTVLVDHDKPDARGRQAGHEAAKECGRRWKEAGRDVFYIVPDVLGHDMADVIRCEP